VEDKAHPKVTLEEAAKLDEELKLLPHHRELAQVVLATFSALLSKRL